MRCQSKMQRIPSGFAFLQSLADVFYLPIPVPGNRQNKKDNKRRKYFDK